MKAGDTVTAYGYEWEILDPEYQCNDGPGILCLTKDIVRTMASSEAGNNDYAKSDIKKYLDEEFTPGLERQGAEFRAVELDLTADDGTGWDKGPLEVKGAFLLTDDLYRKYRRYISNKKDWWWTATAYSFDCFGSHYTRHVDTDGSLNRYSGANVHGGLAPACIFSCLPGRTKDTAEEISDIVTDIRECEANIVKLGLEKQKKLEILQKLMEFEDMVQGYAESLDEKLKSDDRTDLVWLRDNQQITIRTANVFLQGGCRTLWDVSKLTVKEAGRLRNCGVNSLKEIKRAMESYGLHFKEEEE